MNKKIFCILICTLMIATTASAVATTTIARQGRLLSPPSPPVEIVSVYSIYKHPIEEYKLDLINGNANHVEPRLQSGQNTTIEFGLSNPIDTITSVDVTCQQNPTFTTTATWTISPDGLTVTVEFSPALPNIDRNTITLHGDNIDDSFAIVTLEGDCNLDCSVSAADGSYVKGRLEGIIADNPEYIQADINRDGSVSAADKSSVKGRLEDLVPPAP